MSHNQHPQKTEVCEGGAVYAQCAEAANAISNPDLAEVVVRWPTLPKNIQAAILALACGQCSE
jgi:hypothetical protein